MGIFVYKQIRKKIKKTAQLRQNKNLVTERLILMRLTDLIH